MQTPRLSCFSTLLTTRQLAAVLMMTVTIGCGDSVESLPPDIDDGAGAGGQDAVVANEAGGGAGSVALEDRFSLVRVSDDGFGDPNNNGSGAFGVLNGELIVSTRNPTSGAQVYRSVDGETFSPLALDGLGDPQNIWVIRMQSFADKLYLSTWSYVDFGDPYNGFDLIAYDGSEFEPITTDGFGVESLTCGTSMAVHQGALFVGAYNQASFDFLGGPMVWRSTNGLADGAPGSDWAQVNDEGFEDDRNTDATSMASYGSGLFVGTETGRRKGKEPLGDSTNSGTRIYRTAGSGVEIPFDDWTQSNANGFGDPYNSNTLSMAAMGGALYAATTNDCGNPYPDEDCGDNPGGGTLWRTFDGQNWENVSGRGFGDPYNSGVTIIGELDGVLFVATANGVSGSEIWASETGNVGSWVHVGSQQFNDKNNAYVWGSTVFEGELYFGTVRMPKSGPTQLWVISPLDR